METRTDDAYSMAEQMRQHNVMIMAQIGNNLRNGFGAALSGVDYYAIRNEATGILSVIASTTIKNKEDKHIVFGPAPFSSCIEYVNSAVVTLLAEGEVDAGDHNEGEYV